MRTRSANDPPHDAALLFANAPIGADGNFRLIDAGSASWCAQAPPARSGTARTPRLKLGQVLEKEYTPKMEVALVGPTPPTAAAAVGGEAGCSFDPIVRPPAAWLPPPLQHPPPFGAASRKAGGRRPAACARPGPASAGRARRQMTPRRRRPPWQGLLVLLTPPALRRCRPELHAGAGTRPRSRRRTAACSSCFSALLRAFPRFFELLRAFPCAERRPPHWQVSVTAAAVSSAWPPGRATRGEKAKRFFALFLAFRALPTFRRL